jgi:hypothetical protein
MKRQRTVQGSRRKLDKKIAAEIKQMQARQKIGWKKPG